MIERVCHPQPTVVNKDATGIAQASVDVRTSPTRLRPSPQVVAAHADAVVVGVGDGAEPMALVHAVRLAEGLAIALPGFNAPEHPAVDASREYPMGTGVGHQQLGAVQVQVVGLLQSGY